MSAIGNYEKVCSGSILSKKSLVGAVALSVGIAVEDIAGFGLFLIVRRLTALHYCSFHYANSTHALARVRRRFEQPQCHRFEILDNRREQELVLSPSETA